MCSASVNLAYLFHQPFLVVPESKAFSFANNEFVFALNEAISRAGTGDAVGNDVVVGFLGCPCT